MKKFTFLLLLLVACNKDNQHKDFSGSWSFTNTDVSCDFNLTPGAVTSGTFTIKGTKYSILVPYTIKPDADGAVADIYLLNNGVPIFVGLHGVKPSANFGLMLVDHIDYDDTKGNSGVITGPISISRK